MFTTCCLLTAFSLSSSIVSPWHPFDAFDKARAGTKLLLSSLHRQDRYRVCLTKFRYAQTHQLMSAMPVWLSHAPMLARRLRPSCQSSPVVSQAQHPPPARAAAPAW